MRECLTLLIGQAGVQIGDICWNIYCMEHGIQPDGVKISNDNRNENELLDTLFNESYQEYQHYVPRSIMIDNDPSVIDHVMKGPRKNLYSSRLTVPGKEDAANNFGRGFFRLPETILESALDKIRKSLELCDSFQAFLLFNSFSGGTGSGTTARLINELEDHFGKKNRSEFSIFPSPRFSNVVVEPYNAMFRAYHSMSYSSCVFLFDNEACYEICRRQLDVNQAHIHHINQLISHVASSLTASTRFGGPLNVDLAEFETNLVPFPRIHFPTASFAPILSRSKSIYQDMTLDSMTRNVFESQNQMIKYSPTSGEYISCCMLYRGDVTPKEVNGAITRMKSFDQPKFAEWSPTGLKNGISSEPPAMDEDMAQVKRSVCLLSNNTALVQCWEMLIHKYDLMFSKRAFLHWFINEGIEEGDFSEVRDEMCRLIQEYKELAKTGSIDKSSYSITNSEEGPAAQVFNGNYHNTTN